AVSPGLVTHRSRPGDAAGSNWLRQPGRYRLIQVWAINARRCPMKPVERRITLLLAFVALVQACTSDKGLVGPTASKKLAADAADEQPQYGPWSAPVNLGPVINSGSNEQHPAISKDGLSLYFASARTGAGELGVQRCRPDDIRGRGNGRHDPLLHRPE